MTGYNINTKYKHIIWDWNGTLLDDAWLCVEILNGILSRRGKEKTNIETYRRQFGFPVKDYYIGLGFDFSVEPFDVIANEYIDGYNHRRFECKLRNGAVSFLDDLKSAGFEQSILSAYNQNMLEEVVEKFAIKHYFYKLAGLDDYYANGKVHIARKLLNSLEISPKDILLIGDTTHDFDVARDIGADCVLLCGGHQSYERLSKCQCKVVETLCNLHEILNDI